MAVPPADPGVCTDAEVSAGPLVLAAALDASAEATALLDAHGCCVHLNPAGSAVLGVPADDVLGRPFPFATDDPADGARRTVRRAGPGAARERYLEYRAGPVAATDGRRLTVVTFRDVTDARVQRRRFTAFATAAANVADARSLRETLDAICAELVGTADLAGAQIFLIDDTGTQMRVHGAAPVDRWPADFAVRLEEARRRGAELHSFAALRAGRPVVTRGRKARMLADPRWAPLHDQLDGFAWEDFVAVPLVARDRAVGALNAYYASGCAPDDDEIAFLTAMADQAAVAVENARLIAAVRGEAALDERHRLARELHDSACQRLFSMTLHLRAAELSAPAEPTGTLLQTLEQLAHEALDEMRALIFELHPTLLDTHGLVSAVREQAAWVTRRGGPAVAVEGPAARLSLAPDAELDVYRLAQEALHNSVKHAAARHVRVHVAPAADHPDTLLLEITDDGCGFEPAETVPGLGLVSMRERAERLGGQLTVTARPGAGTTVRLVVPRALGDAT